MTANVLAVYPHERVEYLFEIENGRLLAPLIWDRMSETYLNKPQFMCEGKELWHLYKDTNIPMAYRAVHLMAFDYACVIKENYKRMANEIQTFIDFMQISNEHAVSLNAVKDFFNSDPDYPAIGFDMYAEDFHSLLRGAYCDLKEDYIGPDWKDPFDIHVFLNRFKGDV